MQSAWPCQPVNCICTSAASLITSTAPQPEATQVPARNCPHKRTRSGWGPSTTESTVVRPAQSVHTYPPSIHPASNPAMANLRLCTVLVLLAVVVAACYAQVSVLFCFFVCRLSGLFECTQPHHCAPANLHAGLGQTQQRPVERQRCPWRRQHARQRRRQRQQRLPGAQHRLADAHPSHRPAGGAEAARVPRQRRERILSAAHTHATIPD